MSMPDFDMVLFGGTGDLARRKLLPSLFDAHRCGVLHPSARILATGSHPQTTEQYKATLEDTVRPGLQHAPPEAWASFLDRISYVQADARQPAHFDALAEKVLARKPEVVVCYLATAPHIFVPICEQLARTGLNTPNVRVVLEKPLGHDLESSEAINAAVAQYFAEDQIYRIDHYLGKESVQNLMAIRFGNALFEPLWRREWVQDVQITIAEELGVETRGDFYDRTGALRDMVQNHLLQLLCLVAMEPPTYVGRENVRDEKLKVLQALKPLTPADVDRDTVRGQYVAGLVEGERAASYADDLGADRSDTETFVALKAEVQNWRWAGVPFYLRTGKRMDRRVSEIVVVFKEPPHAMFPGAEGGASANRLHICVQPDEGMRLHLTAKEPGPGGIRLRPVSLDLSYATTFDQRSPEAYERLLMDVVRGNPTLFMRRDEVEAAWSWVAPILDRWEESPEAPRRYPAGTPGPFAAAALLERDGRSWQETDQ